MRWIWSIFALCLGVVAAEWMETGLYFSTTTEAVWSGRLLLPLVNDRKKDGSVYFDVYTHPPSVDLEPNSLIRIALDMEQDTWMWEYYNRTAVDINPRKTPKFILDAAENKKVQMPKRIWNWTDLSPLESLAGQRNHQEPIGKGATVDSIEVVIQGAWRFHDDTLYITSEPTVIIGRYVALVKFIGPVDYEKKIFKVQHYDKASRTFDGVLENIYFTDPVISTGSAPSYKKIEESPCGEMGWFVFGEPGVNDTFFARALEPRLGTTLEVPPNKGTSRHLTYKEQRDYFEEITWSNVREEKGKCSALDIENNQWVNWWRPGDAFLMIADYGSSNGRIGGQNNPFIPGLVNHGHFAYGEALVVRDKLTGGLKLDISYWQVNPHGTDGVIAAIFKWSAYMGDTSNRGIGYILPNKAAIIKFPPISHTYRLRDPIRNITHEIQPLKIMRNELAIMINRNRHADGTGVAIVTPYRSCIIDSNLALLTAVRRVKEICKHGHWWEFGKKTMVVLDPADKHIFERFSAWRREFERKVIGWATMRGDWKRELKRIPSKDRYDRWVFGLHSIFRALLSAKTLVPRWGFDRAVSSFLKVGASLRELKVNMMGGIQERLIPAEAFFDSKANKAETQVRRRH